MVLDTKNLFIIYDNVIYVAEIILMESELYVVKSSGDCKFVVSGPIDEVIHRSNGIILIRAQNELILVGVLDVIYDAVLSLLRGQVDKRTMLENLELVLLTIDEVV